MTKPHEPKSAASDQLNTFGPESVASAAAEKQWSETKPGTLQAFAALVQPAPRPIVERRHLVGLAAMAACLFVAVVGISSLYNRDSANQLDSLPRYGGLSCGAVLESRQDFFSDGLASDVHLMTIKHLLDCPRCRRHFEQEAERLGIQLELVAADIDADELPSSSLMLASLPRWQGN